MDAHQYSEECTIISRDRKRFDVRVPSAEIVSNVHVSLRQRVLTLVSLVLVVTDIPRTGLTMTPQDYYERAGPGIVMYWGPYEYHVAHLQVGDRNGSNSTLSTIEAFRDGTRLDLLELWPYKRDTLSIAPRAIAEYLNVTSYPKCVLYRGPCRTETLDPSTVFQMLDDLATAIQLRFFRDQEAPVVFATKSNWVDRLHHILFRFTTDNPDNRLHAYPDVEIDLTTFTSSLIEQTRSNTQYIPSVSYMTDTVEITTLLRGRRCDASRACETVFVDDYRYERSWIESDAYQWTSYLVLLRGGSQVYIWIRVFALLCGCVGASQAASRNARSGFLARCKQVISILVRVPGHTVVYGSWPPLVMYSLAHYFDSSFVQSVGEFTWSTIGGSDSFNLAQYAATVSVQMRNIWMIALLCKLAHALLAEIRRGRSVSINPARVGLLAYRSAWIGVVSWLTTFSLLRAIPFRNTAIVSVQLLSRHIPIESFRSLPVYRNFVDYGARFDLKCTLLAVIVAVAVGWLAKLAVRVVTGRETALFWSTTYYIPLSAGRLWPWSVLDTVWPLKLHDHDATVRIAPAASAGPSEAEIPPELRPFSPLRACAACCYRLSALHWRATLGCPLHEPVLDVPRRSKAVWSMVRLTNLVAMTDPIALVRLYVVGTPLYVYRVRGALGTAPYLLLQPTPPPRAERNAREKLRRATWTVEGAHRLQFVATVDSRDVPWRALLSCG